MILEGTTSSGAVVPVQVTGDGKVVALGETGPQGPEGPEGPQGPPGPGSSNWIQDGIDLHPATDAAEVNLDAQLKFANALYHYASIDGPSDGTGSAGRLTFSTTPSGGTTPVERMRITAAGQCLLGKTQVGLANPGMEVWGNGLGLVQMSANQNHTLALQRLGNDGDVVLIDSPSGRAGRISVSGTSTTYGTSSDYRLKENIEPVTNAVVRLQQLKPYRFNFTIAPDKTVDGFLAHEVQEVIPEAVVGKKDEVDDNGDPVYQGIDQSKLVPLLTAALQEALTRIEALEKKVNITPGQ